MKIPPMPPARTTAEQWPRKRHKDRQRRRRNARHKSHIQQPAPDHRNDWENL